MPLSDLPNPEDPRERMLALAKGTPTATFLMSALLGFNAIQTASTALIPFAPGAFRRINRWAANSWWGLCVHTAHQINNAELVVTGDDIPMRENAIVVVNHQNMPDITWLMDFAKQKGRLGDMKWLVKDIIKYVPGVGWGMLFIDCVFIKRDWATDRESIRQTFARLRDNDVPVWFISFSEGTRITPEKLAQSQDYARKHGHYIPRHTLVPRSKGFVATMEGLRDHVDAVYDCTLGYVEGVPTMWQYIKGYCPKAHLHARRYPIDSLPTDEAGLTDWLHARFREKDELLEGYYATGAFEDTGG
jgi:1-acyl-sn-glycerol-3-phosphate acyltransferase